MEFAQAPRRGALRRAGEALGIGYFRVPFGLPWSETGSETLSSGSDENDTGADLQGMHEKVRDPFSKFTARVAAGGVAAQFPVRATR